MALLDDFVLDYKLISTFDISVLKETLFLPIKKDEYFTKVAIVKESQIKKDLFENQIIKEINSNENDILFCVSDFDFRLDLYNLVDLCMRSDEDLHMENFLNNLFEFSIYKKCSDIHIETETKSLKIRFRIDGVLKTFFSFKKEFFPLLSSIIKLISNLDITQKREPQNGRFEKNINNKSIDFRVSTMPTITGESIVIRILDNSNTKKSLKDIGFDSSNLKKIKNSIKKSNGLILVTGPT